MYEKEKRDEDVNKIFEVHVKHIVYFLMFHIATILTLAFYVGIAYNRLAAAETRGVDNSTMIRVILDNGTPTYRLEFEMLKEKMDKMDNRLERIERNTK